jgi:hypothetical protein
MTVFQAVDPPFATIFQRNEQRIGNPPRLPDIFNSPEFTALPSRAYPLTRRNDRFMKSLSW